MIKSKSIIIYIRKRRRQDGSVVKRSCHLKTAPYSMWLQSTPNSKLPAHAAHCPRLSPPCRPCRPPSPLSESSYRKCKWDKFIREARVVCVCLCYCYTVTSYVSFAITRPRCYADIFSVFLNERSNQCSCKL